MGTAPETAGYVIGFDEKHRLVTIVATGFWDKALLTRFEQELVHELRRRADMPQPFGVLADATALPVQSIPVSIGFMDIVRRLDKRLLVPTAVLTKSVLLRLQALRVFVAPHIRIFGDVEAAHAWLAQAIASTMPMP